MRALLNLLLFIICLQAFASPLPPYLVKIGPNNNPDCVEFVSYNQQMYCSLKPTSPNQGITADLLAQERQKIQFDDRPWQAAWGRSNQGQLTIEYVVLGDDINHWHELITSQFFPGLTGVNPRTFVQLIIDKLHQEGFSPAINLIHSEPDQILFEFRILSPSNMAQDELQKIVKTPQGFYILHYVIKKPDMGQEARDKWIKNLNNSSILK